MCSPKHPGRVGLPAQLLSLKASVGSEVQMKGSPEHCFKGALSDAGVGENRIGDRLVRGGQEPIENRRKDFLGILFLQTSSTTRGFTGSL